MDHERRVVTPHVERRVISSLPAEFRLLPAEPGKLPTLVGYAAVFNVNSELLSERGRRFRERIAPGAFGASIADAAQDTVALVHHDPHQLLGRKSSGTLRLREDRIGLRVWITPPDTATGRDVVELVKRGDLKAMSFAFATVADEWAGKPAGIMERTLKSVRLMDVSLVTRPAYPATYIGIANGADSQADYIGSNLKKRLQLLEKLTDKPSRHDNARKRLQLASKI